MKNKLKRLSYVLIAGLGIVFIPYFLGLISLPIMAYSETPNRGEYWAMGILVILSVSLSTVSIYSVVKYIIKGE